MSENAERQNIQEENARPSSSKNKRTRVKNE